MFSKKEIEIYETDRSIGLTIDWFSPIAYFLLFFSFFWWGFLIFWYSMVLVGGAPLLFALFPIIHVAAGVWMAYYALCLFKNKTYIDVDRNYLSVVHKPIPWWRGNKEIATESILQLYVKEKIKSGKNGTTTTYQLRAKIKDGSDQEIFNIETLESHQVIEIEERLEAFLGITDETVKGEYGARQKVRKVNAPRRQRRNFSDSPISYLYGARLGDFANIKEKELEISALTQYDWNDGDTDKVCQLISADKSEQLIYIEQNKALLQAFAEQSIPIGKTGLSSFPKDKPLPKIKMNKLVFYLTVTKKGMAFPTGVSRNTAITQWTYQTEDKKHQIRFIDYEGQLNAFQGEKLLDRDFQNTLDLNKPPIREDIPLKNKNWDEEDFV